MAITAGLYVPTFLAALGVTQLALDLDAETHKIALFSNTVTPNFTTDTAYGAAPYDANEVTGTNWAAGGVALTGATLTGAGGVITFDATDVSVASVTVSGARGGLIYADALAGNNAVAMTNFGSDVNATAGTLLIQFAAGGIFTWDLTP